MRAIDYGVHNLDALEKAGYRIAALNDAEKSKLIYLTHHLGLTDTIRFIKGTITEAAAERLLIAQVGEKKANWYYENNNNSYCSGHRKWLFKFIDDYININLFVCQEKINYISLTQSSIEQVMIKIKESK
ncbi:hypothetical protein JK232_11670 [Nissabacter archeti]|uniref:Uncharacterized protein n=2 Tax=Nissabacter archeti TaxID=1917880 RepID=A0ABS5JHZ9_9GAMM|nr:hypothetical protein [Nissabacter archeti]